MRHIATSKALSRKTVRSVRRGAAAIEFAIILPLLMLLLLGAADFGRCFHMSIAINNAARTGAEYASMHPFDASTQSAWQAGVKQAAVDEFGQSTWFDFNQLTVTATHFSENSGLRRIRVQANYPFNTIFHWVHIPATINLQAIAVMRAIR